MADPLDNIRKKLEESLKDNEKAISNLYKDRFEKVSQGKEFDQMKFDHKLAELMKKRSEVRGSLFDMVNYYSKTDTTKSIADSIKNTMKRSEESHEENLRAYSKGEMGNYTPKETTENAQAQAMMVAKMFGKYALGRMSLITKIVIVIIFLAIVIPTIYTIFYTNWLGSYGSSIRVSTNAGMTNAYSFFNTMTCNIANFDLFLRSITPGSGPSANPCGDYEPPETFEPILAFSGRVDDTSLGIPIAATFTIDLKQEDVRVDMLTVNPVIKDTAGRQILIDYADTLNFCEPPDNNKLYPVNRNNANDEDTNPCKSPDPERQGFANCVLNQAEPRKEIFFHWDFINATGFKEKYRNIDFTRLVPKFDVHYHVVMDAQTKTVVVTTNQEAKPVPVAGKKRGPVAVEMKFIDDVLVESRYQDVSGEITTPVSIIVKNVGTGRTQLRQLTITPFFDSSLNGMKLSCTNPGDGKPIDTVFVSGRNFTLLNFADIGNRPISIMDLRSITIPCTITIPKTGDTHNIQFKPSVDYVYSHEDSRKLSIEPVPTSIVVTMDQNFREKFVEVGGTVVRKDSGVCPI